MFRVTGSWLSVHALPGSQLPVLPRAWGPDITGASLDDDDEGEKKKKEARSERPWAHSLSSRTMPEAWETVLMWAAAWGALALLKRHFGLAIEVGRQGQEQARLRRKSLPDRVAFLHPTPVHPPAGHT